MTADANVRLLLAGVDLCSDLSVEIASTQFGCTARIADKSGTFQCVVDDEVGLYTLAFPEEQLLFELDPSGTQLRQILAALGRKKIELVQPTVGKRVMSPWIEVGGLYPFNDKGTLPMLNRLARLLPGYEERRRTLL